jgi:hypothetical protein
VEVTSCCVAAFGIRVRFDSIRLPRKPVLAAAGTAGTGTRTGGAALPLPLTVAPQRIRTKKLKEAPQQEEQQQQQRLPKEEEGEALTIPPPSVIQVSSIINGNGIKRWHWYCRREGRQYSQ